jgi:hypothetical protein
MRRQDGADTTMTVVKLYSKEPFRIGLLAGFTKSRVFEPDLFFSTRWDQINYERGYQFSSYLKTQGVRISKLPKKMPRELQDHLQDAVRSRSII